MYLPESRTRSVRDNDELEEAIRLAEQALEEVERSQDAAIPESYRLWFAYVASRDALRERIDRELFESRGLSLAEIEADFRKRFPAETLPIGKTETGVDPKVTLGDVVATLRKGLAEDQASSASARHSPSPPPSTEGPGCVVEELNGLVEAHSRRTELLNSELAEAKAKVDRLQAELLRISSTAHLDHLTQLANRRHMEEVLEREIALARASGDPLSFALCDLDHFKRLNDTYGHAVGDAVLKHFGALVQRNVKGQDTPARFGGEEFAIIFPRTALLNAGRVADGIRRQLCGARLSLGPASGPIEGISASFGVTQLLPSDSAEALVERADRLLYRAKETGRNMVVTEV